MLAVLRAHLEFCRTQSPPDHVHAFEPERFAEVGASLFAARVDGEVVAVGALNRLVPTHAEIKSMHTLASARGHGVGRAMLGRLLAEARASGARRVSLETGTMDGFAAARDMYAAHGFVPCPPFAGYTDNPYSTCFTLVLD